MDTRPGLAESKNSQLIEIYEENRLLKPSPKLFRPSEPPAHPVEPAMPGLGQPAGGLDPAEPFLDALVQLPAGAAPGCTRASGGG